MIEIGDTSRKHPRATALWKGFFQLAPLIAGLFGVWLSAHFTAAGSRREDRQKAYARLAGAEAIYLDALSTQLQTQWDASVGVNKANFTKTPEFNERAMKGIELNWAKVEKLGEARRELWEALAAVRVSFFEDQSLQRKIADVMSPRPWGISDVVTDPKTPDDFTAHSQEAKVKMEQYLRDDVKPRLDAILQETLIELQERPD